MSEKIKISTHSPFQKLKVAAIGQVLSEDTFDWITEEKIKGPMQRILKETNEDLLEFKRVLEGLGVEVYQPESLHRGILSDEKQIPHVPLQPRDVFLTLGDKCYQQNTHQVYDYMKNIVHEDCMVDLFNEVYGLGGESFEGHELISGANSVKLGKHIIMPADGPEGFVHPDRPMFNHIIHKWKQQGYEIIQTDDVGHTDGIISFIKPGAFMRVGRSPSQERELFSKWDRLELGQQGWMHPAMNKWMSEKNLVNGRWWIDGEQDNPQLHKFINDWCDHWVGYCAESVFDVNTLGISEQCVLVSSYNKEVFKFLEKHNVEPIIVPLRHRYFWDGGLHCCSLDLVREGQREDYLS
jgi:hypothetical protein